MSNAAFERLRLAFGQDAKTLQKVHLHLWFEGVQIIKQERQVEQFQNQMEGKMSNIRRSMHTM